jgi:hypothetical protein
MIARWLGLAPIGTLRLSLPAADRPAHGLAALEAIVIEWTRGEIAPVPRPPRPLFGAPQLAGKEIS